MGARGRSGFVWFEGEGMTFDPPGGGNGTLSLSSPQYGHFRLLQLLMLLARKLLLTAGWVRAILCPE